MKLEEAVKQFLEYLEIERNVSQLTVRNYNHYLHRLVMFLAGLLPAATADLNVEDLTADRIREYRLFLSRFSDDKGMSLKRVTQNYHLIAVRSFLKYMMKRDISAVHPEKIDLAKAESHSLKFLERSDVDRLLSMPSISDEEGLRDKAILELLFSTGLRVSELVGLNRDQINFERREFGVIGKGRRARVVFLSDGAVEWVERYLASRRDESKALFIRYNGPTPESGAEESESLRLSARSVQRMVEKYVKKAKLPIKITPHGLRHSYATDLLHNGADLRAIQEMLGHKNVSTTQIYTHVTNPQLREIHHKFHRK